MKYIFIVYAIAFALQAHSQTANDYLQNGINKTNLKDYAGALQEYNKAIGIDPNMEGAYMMRGTTKHLLGDFNGAIRDFTKSIEINPVSADAYYCRGYAKEAIKEYIPAIQDLNKTIDLNPAYEGVYFLRGSIYVQVKNYKAAISDLNKVLELEPQNEEARSVLKTVVEMDGYDQILKQLNEPIIPKHEADEKNATVASTKNGGLGTNAPDFTQNDISGEPISLSSFKGQYVLLYFWASWSGPCHNENLNVVENFNKFKTKKFSILGVSLDKEKSKWIETIKIDKLNWTQVSDLKGWNNSVALLYQVQSSAVRSVR
jgi:tetratricopeptide (TPR) repeat protein